MPRAPDFNPLNPVEHVTAAAYALPRVKAAFTSADLKADGGHLFNSTTGAIYAVIAATPLQNGCVAIPVDADHQVKTYNGKKPHWLVVVLTSTSEIMLFQWDVLASPNSGATINGNWLVFNLASAKATLAKKVVPRAKGEKAFMDVRAVEQAASEDLCHLHVHSMYSFLDAIATPEGLVRRAVEAGQPGIAITEHGNMHSAYKFYKAAREAKIRPVMGVEFYIVDDVSTPYTDGNVNKDGVRNKRRHEYHLTVLAMNNEGWFNLCKLCSLASRDNFYYVNRIDHKTLFENGAGLIVLSGCFKGHVAWHMAYRDSKGVAANDVMCDAFGRPIYRRDPDYSRQIIRMYKQRFGDRYYGEVHNNDYPLYMDVLPDLCQLLSDEGLKICVAADAHYETAEDAGLRALVSKVGKSSAGDGLGTSATTTGPYYIRTAAEMNHHCFRPDFITRTCEVMERCNVHIPLQGEKDFKYLFPAYPYQDDADWAEYQAARAVLGPVKAPIEHESHRMHPNSLQAQPETSERSRQVLDEVAKLGKATDRQVMNALGFVDPNAVRPRITELIAAGMLREIGCIPDAETGKTVRVVAPA